MTLPLIRQGEGPARAYLRLHEERLAQRRRLDRTIGIATASNTEQERKQRGLIGQRSAEGDEARLRGIPAIGRNVAGAIPGTRPDHPRN